MKQLHYVRYYNRRLKELNNKKMNKQLNALGAFEDLELFNKDGNLVYEFYTNSRGYWCKRTRDSNGNKLTYENSDGDWYKCTYDSKGNVLTFESSNGVKRGFDIPELTMEDIAEKLGYDFKIKK